MIPEERRALELTAVQVANSGATDLFGNDPANWNRICRVLAKKWSKSVPGTEEFRRLRALSKIRTTFSALKTHNSSFTSAETEKKVEIAGVGSFPYLAATSSGGVDTYIGHHQVVLKFRDSDRDLVNQYRTNWGVIQGYINSVLPAFDRAYFPWVNAVNIELVGGDYFCLVISKPKAYLSLQRVLDVKGRLDSRHVAWILTRLYHQACLMQVAGAVNLEVIPKNIYINPGSHELVLLGGWQYASSPGVKSLAAPLSTRLICPSLVESKGVVSMAHVGDMIRYTGNNLLGNVLGESDGVPPPLREWLSRPFSNADAREELAGWNVAKVEAFGPSQPIKWDLTPQQLYENPSP